MGNLKVQSTPHGAFTKGIPYLLIYLSCVEGLSAMLKKAKLSRCFRGISLCNWAPQVSHLFFTDNNIIFCQENIEECNQVLRVLHEYDIASGQKLNREKKIPSSLARIRRLRLKMKFKIFLAWRL